MLNIPSLVQQQSMPNLFPIKAELFMPTEYHASFQHVSWILSPYSGSARGLGLPMSHSIGMMITERRIQGLVVLPMKGHLFTNETLRHSGPTLQFQT